MSKYLVVTPIHERLDDLTLRCLYELQTPQGSRLDYYQPRYGYADSDDGGRTNLAEKQNQARAIALEHGYDYLLFVEEDMVVPQDAIMRLHECESDVAYGLYVFRRLPFFWSAYVVIDEDVLVGNPLCRARLKARQVWEQPTDVDGLGFGCTLIDTRVLHDVEFRIDWDKPHPGGEFSHSDFYFAVDLINAGAVQRCHTGVRCGHISPLNELQFWQPSILWPVIDGQDGAMYQFAEYPV